MTWDAGPCLLASEPVQPTTDEELRALVTHVEDPARQQNSPGEFAYPVDRTGVTM